MDRKMKYIVFVSHGNEQSVVFPDTIAHNDMSRMMRADKVLGAGFCDLRQGGARNNLKFKCYGRSVSLNIDSREEDSVRVTMDYLGLNYQI